jgi:predicted MFS family arabinose efflux permease
MVSRPGRGRLTDSRRILSIQALRAFAYGLGSVLIGVTLAEQGLSTLEAGLVLTALLLGVAAVSLLLARYGDRLGRRRSYRALLVTMGLSGVVFALTGSVFWFVVAALTGTVSTDVVESGPFTSLEQAMLPFTTEGSATRLFGTYNIVATLAGSLGALAAGAADLVDVRPQRLLLLYPVVALLALVVSTGLSPALDGSPRTAGTRPLERSRRVVARLSGLFALDSFGGGFVVQAYIAFWFTREWGTSLAALGVIFFAVGILQAASFDAAVRLARRIGLVRTMVFTHLPSNVLLAAIPFASTEGGAIALLLARFALSQMDVPARQALVVGVVDPAERTAAAAYTNTARYVTRPLGTLCAAPLAQASLGAPFVVAGAVKSAYDLGFFAAFRRVDLS